MLIQGGTFIPDSRVPVKRQNQKKAKQTKNKELTRNDFERLIIKALRIK